VKLGFCCAYADASRDAANRAGAITLRIMRRISLTVLDKMYAEAISLL
jgi:hypothetical protein